MDLSKLHLHWGACKRGRKVHKSYSLARSFRVGGKNKKEVVLTLGKLSEQQADQWRHLLKLAKQPNIVATQCPTVITNKAYLDIATVLEAWNAWDLSTVFDKTSEKKRRGIPLSVLAALLTINRCIDPTSKSQVPVWVEQTSLDLLLNISTSDINPSRVFRELSAIEECKDALVRHLYEKVTQRNPSSTKRLFYDLSSTTFSGSRCILMKWGHCKEGYKNHIVLALIVSTEGLPIYWEVLNGCTADVTTISWLLNRLNTKLQTTTPVMIFDRGMVSDDNLTLLETGQIKYITAMDKNQIASIADMSFQPFERMTENTVEEEMQKRKGFSQLDKDTYCKEIGVKEGRRYILCFNAQLFKDQRKARRQHLADLHSFVDAQNEDLCRAKRDRTEEATQKKFDAQVKKLQLHGFVTIKLMPDSAIAVTNKGVKTSESYCAKIRVNRAKEREIGRLDGFWLLVTNLSEQDDKTQFVMDTQAVVRPYKDKVIIESSFKDIKSFVEVGPVHVWKEEHVRAHYTLCVLAHLLNRTLSLQLHKQHGLLTEDVVSHAKLYEELSSCHLNHISVDSNQNLYSLTLPTDRQKELLERVGATHLIKGLDLAQLNSNGGKMTRV